MDKFVKNNWVPLKPREYIKACMEQGMTRRQAKVMLNAPRGECWVNSLYVVALKRSDDVAKSEQFILPKGTVWLSVRRQDREPIMDWRHMQEMKNQLVGPECEAIQIFPAESRLMDTSNQFHLICFTDPKLRVPMGYFCGRQVSDGNDFLKSKQRPLGEENKS